MLGCTMYPSDEDETSSAGKAPRGLTRSELLYSENELNYICVKYLSATCSGCDVSVVLYVCVAVCVHYLLTVTTRLGRNTKPFFCLPSAFAVGSLLTVLMTRCVSLYLWLYICVFGISDADRLRSSGVGNLHIGGLRFNWMRSPRPGASRWSGSKCR